MLRTLTIIVTLALAGAVAAQGLSVALHGEVYVAGRVILLSEVAELTGDAGLKATADRITCGRSPAAGSKSAVELTREYVMNRLMSAGIPEARIDLKGPEKVLVYGAEAWGREAGPKNPIPAASAVSTDQPATTGQPSTTSAGGSMLPAPEAPTGTAVGGYQSLVSIAVEEIRSSAASRLNADVEDIEINERVPNNFLLRLPAGEVRFISVENAGNRGSPLGKQAWEIKATVNGAAPQGKLILNVTIARVLDTVVANRPLMPGTLIGESDVRVVRLPHTSMVQTTYSSVADVIGMEARTQTINEGQPIETSKVQPGKLIKRGDTVTMTAVAGSTKLTITGKAVSDGVRGGTVTVEWTFAGANGRPEIKKVEARVTGVGTAEIQ